MRLLRPTGEDRPVRDTLDESDLYITAPESVTAFPDGQPELCVVEVHLVQAMLLTPTCNLKDNAGTWIDYWLFAPLQSISTVEGVDPRIFFSTSSGFKNSFGIRADPLGSFPDSFIDFHNIVSVPSLPFQDRSLRIKTLSKAAYNHLLDKTVNFLGATWGYAINEAVEKTGQYRCIRCTRYSGIDIKDKSLEKGALPGECENCGARASWVLLETFKKKKV